MNIITKKISELKPYERNAKIHTKEQINRIANSIKLTKGLRQPIVIDKDGVIIAGHGRYLAAKQLKMKEVPCELADDLTEDEIKAYRLADNRLAEGEIDVGLELDELQDIGIDMEPLGFELFDMDDIQEVDGYDENNDDREYFSATFTFPTAKKKQILSYLRKHKKEITQDIIDKAG